MNTDVFRPLRLIHLFIAIALFCALFWLSYPYYRYYIDPDAVAYLTMAEQGALGEPMRLVNALWSPLHPALVALCLRGGIPSVLAAQLTNSLACILILSTTFGLFRRFRIERFLGMALLGALSVFLVYALYKQLFCDLWQVGLLLLYLLTILSADFFRKPVLWMLGALIMALAVYAKIYSFYFLLLHFPLSLLIQSRREGLRFPWKAFATTAVLLLLMLAPWSFLMHKKYSTWAFSKSGALNTSWTLAGHKSLRPDIGALIPPPYPNSPYTWEDPYLSEGMLHSRFESLAMIKSGAGHSIQAALQGVEAANQISCVLLPLLAASLLVAFSRRQRLFDSDAKVLLAAMAIMPLGYLLLHFEARYIWLLLPLSMVIGALWLQAFSEKFPGIRAYRLAGVLLALSFVAWPIYDMKALFRQGEGTYNLAGVLAAKGIRGSFTSNDNPGRAGLLAYWMGCNYYTPSSDVVRQEDVLADMRRYKVTYYFHHQNGLDAATPFMLDERGQPFKRVDGGAVKGLQIFLINP